MDLIGQTLGNYQIIEEIGRGGMAVVYKAWQPSLQRYVALKILPDYFRHDAQFVARFQREARAAAKLNHPSIVAIYDVGVYGGTHYIAMEYVEGSSLQERLAGGRLSPTEARPILDQVAGALDHAHNRGVVHRDIKPGNILLTADGVAKVTDFGIARAADGTQLTRTGVILGTPEYMAPEQAAGGVVDYRVDLYALGVVLYQMLTGQAPFRGTTPHATLHAVIYESPRPPRQVNPEVSRAVEAVLLKALAKAPEERFQSGREMARAYRRSLLGERVRVPSSAREPARAKGRDRRPVLPLVGSIVLVALLLVGVAGWLLLSSGGDGEAEATAEAQSATGTALALLEGNSRATAEALQATQSAAEMTAKAMDPESATGTAAALEAVRETATAQAVRGATGTAVAAETAIDAAVRETAEAMATQTAAAHPTETATPPFTPTSPPTSTPKPAPTAVPTSTPVPEPTKTPRPPKPSAGDVKTRGSDGMKMVYVPAGEFVMGSDAGGRESPKHKVYVDAFWIDRTEVTNDQYRKCVQAGSCQAPGGCWVGTPTFNDAGKGNHPVVCVNWYSAQAYCNWAGGRLPTEAEWERAARGTQERTYPWGNGGPDCGRAQYNACGAHTVAVGSKGAGASPYGALDMAGNVWEWTRDWYGDGYYGNSPPNNPTGPASGDGKLMRGGSWDAGPNEIRATFRNAIQPDFSGNDVGFRCVQK